MISHYLSVAFRHFKNNIVFVAPILALDFFKQIVIVIWGDASSELNGYLLPIQVAVFVFKVFLESTVYVYFVESISQISLEKVRFKRIIDTFVWVCPLEAINEFLFFKVFSNINLSMNASAKNVELTLASMVVFLLMYFLSHIYPVISVVYKDDKLVVRMKKFIHLFLGNFSYYVFAGVVTYCLNIFSIYLLIIFLQVPLLGKSVFSVLILGFFRVYIRVFFITLSLELLAEEDEEVCRLLKKASS